MEKATYAASAIVAAEAFWRFSKCNPFLQQSNVLNPFLDFLPSAVYSLAYVACICVICLDLKRYHVFQGEGVRGLITALHRCDSVFCLLMGVSIAYNSQWLLIIAVLGSSKCFLLNFIHRAVTGERATTKFQLAVQTTKTFVHHTASFYFISDPTVALLTGIWRAISISGHAALAIRSTLQKQTYDKLMWKLTHIRNLTMITVAVIVIVAPSLRRGFAISGFGHAAYLVIRLVAIYRRGTNYFDSEDDSKVWTEQLTDSERLGILISLRYSWFLFELVIMAVVIFIMVILRVTTTAKLQDFCSIV